jgi:hypothetical protein
MVLLDLLSRLTTSENRYVTEQQTIRAYRDGLKLVTSHYQLSESAQQWLGALGVTTSPDGYIQHPHPVSATIREYIMSRAARLIGSDPVTVVSSKTEKAAKFFGEEARLQQPIIEPRDIYRYNGTQAIMEPIETPAAYFDDSLQLAHDSSFPFFLSL